MGGREPGETQGGKPRRKKGDSSHRKPRRGGRGGPRGASDWGKRAEREGNRKNEGTEVVSKGINELDSRKAEAERKKEVRMSVMRNGNIIIVMVCSLVLVLHILETLNLTLTLVP